MRSRNARNTSSSTGSRKSTKKRATSPPKKNSSATSPASFAQVFGQPENPERTRVRQMLADTKARLAAWQAIPAPNLALLRVRHQQRGARLRAHIRHIEEYLATELLT